ncbi:hypothetical protein IC620_06365 [Hazenella sp. IB182357]|uniref:Uncharacterized protein n=1 Tax=Polycladospora coralii TaxID=2771432 RepID=A0A926N9P8_9BACL|nr:hypothetical protein [Polycladospora coralii]MBD1371982.1 hypothetical protein [Polycladospora coralii]
MKSQYDVVLIGSGQSGLDSVKHLEENGKQVLYLNIDQQTLATLIQVSNHDASPINQITSDEPKTETFNMGSAESRLHLHKQTIETQTTTSTTFTFQSAPELEEHTEPQEHEKDVIEAQRVNAFPFLIKQDAIEADIKDRESHMNHDDTADAPSHYQKQTIFESPIYRRSSNTDEYDHKYESDPNSYLNRSAPMSKRPFTEQENILKDHPLALPSAELTEAEKKEKTSPRKRTRLTKKNRLAQRRSVLSGKMDENESEAEQTVSESKDHTPSFNTTSIPLAHIDSEEHLDKKKETGSEKLKSDQIEFEDAFGYSSFEEFITPFSENSRKRQEIDQIEKRKMALRGLHNLINHLG